MSMETMSWLNQNVLVGQTDKRGTAWHYRADEQGDEANHYTGFIPVEDVKRRLFNWKPVEGDITSNVVTEDGVLTVRDPKRKAIIRPDLGVILGIFKDGYQIHDYEEWLLENVGHILDDNLGISSAGLLKQGGVAWVEVSVPETIETPSGVKFRPNLLAGTSLDGSLATTYKRTITNTVCDNTMGAALSEDGGQIKVKHSRYSNLKLADAREALEIVHSTADDFTAEVEKLTNVTVSDGDWSKFLDEIAAVPEEDGRSRTMALNKRETLSRLWNHDERVAPWKGTAWGVVQAVNTATHHEFTAKGNRVERNMLATVTGKFDKLDADTREVLAGVIGGA